MIISGIATFGGKFLQEKFNLPAALASFVMGKIIFFISTGKHAIDIDTAQNHIRGGLFHCKIELSNN